MWSRVPFTHRLETTLGRPRRARLLDSSPRSRVWRVELPGTSAVVKQLVGGPGAQDRYTREVTALELAARARPIVAPALLGSDPDTRVLVLEHVPHAGPSPEWLIDYATTLARLHATTTSADANALPRWKGPTHADVTSFLSLADALGTAIPSGAPGELAALVDRLTTTNGHALLHGDPCPGNDLHTSNGVRFIDFEQASFGDGVVELAYLRIGFPTCWCVTAPPAPLLERAETAYRTTWSALTGTPVTGDLADACAGWLIRGDALVPRAERETVDHLSRIPAEDWSWGTVTARRRLAHRLGVVANDAAEPGPLTAVARLAADMRVRLLERGPADPPPAERPSGS